MNVNQKAIIEIIPTFTFESRWRSTLLWSPRDAPASWGRALWWRNRDHKREKIEQAVVIVPMDGDDTS
jgi:hypothetical protein